MDPNQPAKPVMIVEVNGSTLEELWGNLIGLVSEACHSKQRSESGSYPQYIDVQDLGSIAVRTNRPIPSRSAFKVVEEETGKSVGRVLPEAVPPLDPVTFENGLQVTLQEDGRIKVSATRREHRRILIEPSSNDTCLIGPAKWAPNASF